MGATNFRNQQSYCVVRAMNADGSVYNKSTSSCFSTNNTSSKQVDQVVMTVNLIPFQVANSLHLRCRLTSNGTDKPKNSLIMYWVEQ